MVLYVSLIGDINVPLGLVKSIVNVSEELPLLFELSLAQIVKLCWPSVQIMEVMLVQLPLIPKLIFSDIVSLEYQQEDKLKSETV